MIIPTKLLYLNRQTRDKNIGKIVGHDIGNSTLKEVTGEGEQRLIPLAVKFLTEAERNTGRVSKMKNGQKQSSIQKNHSI
ncbi:hypothetical protein LJR153_007394 [Paenibacillus sp. LjRoot153]|uniref:hypothetical protein n=1 Tax=Paenibacillus sp. LjRoot153 TaxID=3342270 RepID=UPI003ECE825F